jgi:hypothetical protein
MNQYVRKELNPPGLRLSRPGEPSCADCQHAVSGMADAHSGAMTCRAGHRDVPVRQDFLCNLYEPADGEDQD